MACRDIWSSNVFASIQKNESVHIKHYHGLYKLFEHNFLAVWQYMRKILNNLQRKYVIILKIMGFTQNAIYNVILFLVSYDIWTNRPPLPCIHSNVCINIKYKIFVPCDAQSFVKTGNNIKYIFV